MTKNTSASANLLLLSHLYEAQATRFLRKFAVLEPGFPKTDQLINPHLGAFLKRYFRAKPIDIENWASANETVLMAHNFGWKDDLHRLKAETDKGTFSIVQFLGEDPSWEIVALLTGSGTIPPLTIRKYIGIHGRESSQTYSSKIGHFGFLVPAIQRIIWANGEELTHIVENFIDQNRAKLDKMRSWFESEPRELGSGSDGTAFAIGQNRVLKIFRYENAYNAALKAMHRLWKVPQAAGTEAMIYDVGKFNPIILGVTEDHADGEFPIYYYITERMIPVDDMMPEHVVNQLCDTLREIVDDHVDVSWFAEALNDPTKLDQLRKDVRKNARLIEGKMRAEYPKAVKEFERSIENYSARSPTSPSGIMRRKLRSDWLTRLCEEIIWKFTTKRTDLHGGNLGLTPYGALRYFDPAYK